MPIYVYEPTRTAPEEPVLSCCFFEALQSLHEAPLTSCPHCGHPVHRGVTNFSIKNLPVQKEKKSEHFNFTPQPSSAEGGESAARLALKHICSGSCTH